jgi:hypothetical protein
MASKRKFGEPMSESLDDIWQRRGMSSAVCAVRKVITGGTIPPGTPIGRLNDIELGWLVAAGLFAWLGTRAEQATAEGTDTELALRLTGLDPEPWDAGAVAYALPDIGNINDVDWNLPVASWPKHMIVKFLLGAMPLVRKAMIARDVGGVVGTRRKSLEEMQRVASAETGGSLVTPDELNDAIPTL